MQETINNLKDRIRSLEKEKDEISKSLDLAESKRTSLEKQILEKNSVVQSLQQGLGSSSLSEISQYAALDRHSVWAPSPERDALHPELSKFLKDIAINNEVLVAISNENYAVPGGMLDLWVKGVKLAGIENAMVIALDNATKSNMDRIKMPSFRMDVAIPESQKEVGSNHAVSGLKFRILMPFMELGYSVLLSDVDVLHLRNPFHYLARDSDVEAMSDGWDQMTAYGYNDVAVSRLRQCIICLKC